MTSTLLKLETEWRGGGQRAGRSLLQAIGYYTNIVIIICTSKYRLSVYMVSKSHWKL